MPRIAVRMNPEGSLSPGMMNFAITPATKADDDGPEYAHLNGSFVT